MNDYMKALAKIMSLARQEYENSKLAPPAFQEHHIARFEALMDAYTAVEEVMNENTERED